MSQRRHLRPLHTGRAQGSHHHHGCHLMSRILPDGNLREPPCRARPRIRSKRIRESSCPIFSPFCCCDARGLSTAKFAYSIVGFHGTGRLTYQEALAAVFLEGWVFFFLSIFGIRQWLARAMPHSLVMAVGAGIGIFIACVSDLFILQRDQFLMCDSDDRFIGLCESLFNIR